MGEDTPQTISILAVCIIHIRIFQCNYGILYLIDSLVRPKLEIGSVDI